MRIIFVHLFQILLRRIICDAVMFFIQVPCDAFIGILISCQSFVSVFSSRVANIHSRAECCQRGADGALGEQEDFSCGPRRISVTTQRALRHPLHIIRPSPPCRLAQQCSPTILLLLSLCNAVLVLRGTMQGNSTGVSYRCPCLKIVVNPVTQTCRLRWR